MDLSSLDIKVNQSGHYGIHDDLTIDVGVLRRSKTKMLIHICGTHGVEGFVGSAIQSFLLDNSTIIKKADHDDDTVPTLVFVHALNPFGFAHLRRVNENNVDLNRNFLTESQFEKLKARDPNHFGYVDLMELINPTKINKKWDFFYLKAILHIAKKGYGKLKGSLVTGNYHYSESLFFGGFEMQQSHLLLKTFLLDQFNMPNMKAIGLIDVHSGLGSSGFDSILLHSNDLEEGKQIFGGNDNEFDNHLSEDFGHVYNRRGNKADHAMSGYDHAVGFVPKGMADQLFPSSSKMFLITQEFGTIPGVLVFKAMRAENFMYHYDPTYRMPKHGDELQHAFYLKYNPVWKDNVVTRGEVVYNQLHLKLSSI